MAPLSEALTTTGASVHWYGKGGGVKSGRKMGHVTCIGESAAAVDAAARPIMLAAGAKTPETEMEKGDIALCIVATLAAVAAVVAVATR